MPWCSTWRPKPRSADRSRSSATGDRIRLDVASRTLDVLVDDARARGAPGRLGAAGPPDVRGFRRLHCEHVLQANHGCDFDFLRGASGVVTEHVTYL